MPNLSVCRVTALHLLVIALLVPAGESADAQVQIERDPSRFNLFTIEQEIEIGRESATTVERQLALLDDAGVDGFLTGIVDRLAAQAPGADYPYRIRAVNAAEVNAFALPGGPMYVHRGLVTTVRNEAELAGVLAHEMAHVALRHGTAQASKAYLGQAGLSILGGLLGTGTTADIVNTIGGFGLNAVFLKFSRSDEREADALGAEIMSRAGYDPVAMATMFDLLQREQTRAPSRLEEFFSSHPSPQDREERIREVARALGGGRLQVVGGLGVIQSRLSGYAAAPAAPPNWNTSRGTIDVPPQPIVVDVPDPSERFLRLTQQDGFFTIDYPANWRVYSRGLAVSLAPDGGVVELGNGQPQLLVGAIVNHYEPFENEGERWASSLRRHYTPFEDRANPRGSLEDATDDLVRQIRSANPYLTAPAGSAQPLVLDGQRAWAVLLRGPSPLTGQVEHVTVYTRLLPDGHVIYALCVTPESEAHQVQPACTRMIQSLRVNDAAAHRQPGSSPRR
jgi:Zn-dependent protease with chaperone function